jgi:hypothetical protein
MPCRACPSAYICWTTPRPNKSIALPEERTAQLHASPHTSALALEEETDSDAPELVVGVWTLELESKIMQKFSTEIVGYNAIV